MVERPQRGWYLDARDRWRSYRVLVDGEERAVAADGTFDGTGRMVMVRQGPLCTRVAPGEPLPFTDRRLA